MKPARVIDFLEMRAQEQRVAVRRLRNHIACRNYSPCRRFVFDDNRLAQRGAEFVGDEARRNVGRPAGAEANQKPDRPVGVSLLRARLRCAGEHQHERRERGDDFCHAALS